MGCSGDTTAGTTEGIRTLASCLSGGLYWESKLRREENLLESLTCARDDLVREFADRAAKEAGGEALSQRLERSMGVARRGVRPGAGARAPPAAARARGAARRGVRSQVSRDAALFLKRRTAIVGAGAMAKFVNLDSAARRVRAEMDLLRAGLSALDGKTGEAGGGAARAYGFTPLLKSVVIKPVALKPADPSQLSKAFRPATNGRARREKKAPRTPKAAVRARGDHGSPKSVIIGLVDDDVAFYDEEAVAMPPPGEGGFDFKGDALFFVADFEDFSDCPLMAALADAIF